MAKAWACQGSVKTDSPASRGSAAPAWRSGTVNSGMPGSLRMAMVRPPQAGSK